MPIIIQVASPGHLSDRWHDIIDDAHKDAFGGRMSTANMRRHWWFAGIVDKKLAGVAGAYNRGDESIHLGPCIVFPEFRGRRLQRDFIRARERLAIEEGLVSAFALTNRDNYASVNNLLASGFRMVEPEDNSHLCWRKTLCPSQRSSRSA